jgi:hypothetical protein
MALHRKRKKSEVPHIPFYKDERIIGKKITLSVSLRLLILALVIFVLTVGWALFSLFQAESDLSNYVRGAHLARMEDQQRVDHEIDQLACYLVAPTPNNPKMPIIKKFRDYYHCPPYGQDPNLRLYGKHPMNPEKGRSKSGQVPGGDAATNKSHSQPGSGNAHQTVVAGPRPSSSPHPTPSPRPTSSPSPTPSPTVVHLPVSVPPVASVGPVGVGGTCTVRVGNTCLVH